MLLTAQSGRNLRNKKLFVLEFIRPKMQIILMKSPSFHPVETENSSARQWRDQIIKVGTQEGTGPCD